MFDMITQVCTYMCMYDYIYVHVCVCVCVCDRTLPFRYEYSDMHVYLCMYIYVYIHVCIIHVCIYVHTHGQYVHRYLDVYMYVFMYVYRFVFNMVTQLCTCMFSCIHSRLSTDHRGMTVYVCAFMCMLCILKYELIT